MRKLRIIIIILSVVFTLSLILQVLGILVAGKQFIYNLSQMEYEDAYRVVEGMIESHLPEQYRGFWSKEQIRQELDRYLASASELNVWEIVVYELRPSVQSGILKQVGMYNAVILIILLIWHELWDAKRQEAQEIIA